MFESGNILANLRDIHTPWQDTEPRSNDECHECSVSHLGHDRSSGNDHLRIHRKEEEGCLWVEHIGKESFFVALKEGNLFRFLLKLDFSVSWLRSDELPREIEQIHRPDRLDNTEEYNRLRDDESDPRDTIRHMDKYRRRHTERGKVAVHSQTKCMLHNYDKIRPRWHRSKQSNRQKNEKCRHDKNWKYRNVYFQDLEECVVWGEVHGTSH